MLIMSSGLIIQRDVTDSRSFVYYLYSLKVGLIANKIKCNHLLHGRILHVSFAIDLYLKYTLIVCISQATITYMSFIGEFRIIYKFRCYRKKLLLYFRL